MQTANNNECHSLWQALHCQLYTPMYIHVLIQLHIHCFVKIQKAISFIKPATETSQFYGNPVAISSELLLAATRYTAITGCVLEVLMHWRLCTFVWRRFSNFSLPRSCGCRLKTVYLYVAHLCDSIILAVHVKYPPIYICMSFIYIYIYVCSIWNYLQWALCNCNHLAMWKVESAPISIRGIQGPDECYGSFTMPATLVLLVGELQYNNVKRRQMCMKSARTLLCVGAALCSQVIINTYLQIYVAENAASVAYKAEK